MKSELKQAFDSIHAQEELKARTRTVLARRCAPRRPRPLRMAVAVCALFFLMLLGGGTLYFSPVAVISVDVNPSLEMSVNRFDRVVDVRGYNEEGDALAQAVPLRFLNYEQAVERLLSSEQMQSYLNEDAALSIGVIGADAQRCGAMMNRLENCTADSNAHCYTAGSEVLDEAHELGMSCGKYQAFLQLQALDPTVTPEQVQDMTMREIRDRLNQLGAPSTQAGGHHSGGGNGYGRHHD